ncbi:Gala protein type 1, 3 or 4 [Legionella wadsworthii]|uniref:Gala protein type 1, 3 or 4 n=2 Tax=Legionella wadsworthii TaxID=28088 RepID=A0A378LUJ8_9GAMM|nr:Gala protein type 1, 3 or 4 [Legionella wadsworthii]
MYSTKFMLFDLLVRRYYHYYFTEMPVMKSLQNPNAVMDLSNLKKHFKIWQMAVSSLDNNPTVEYLTCQKLPEEEVTQKFIIILMDALSKNTQIKALTLRNNPLTSSAPYIAQMLELNTTLKSINLSGTQIDAGGIRALAIAFEKNNNLKSIKLNHLKIESNTDHLFEVLSKKKSLQELEIMDCNLQVESGLLKLLSENQSLKKLHLGLNYLDKGIDYLVDGLRQNTSLTSLNVMSCGLDLCDPYLLAEAISQHPSLTHLDLSYNGLNPIENPLPTLILDNSSIRSLNLSRNGIEDEGIRYISSSIKNNQSLNTLILNGNHITDKGVGHLSEALQQNNTLVHLDITENDITSVRILTEQLQNNITITSIDCDQEKISDGSWPALDELLKRNQQIKGSYLVLLNEAEAINDMLGMLNVLKDMKNEFYHNEEHKWKPESLKNIYVTSFELVKSKLMEQLHGNENQEQSLLNVIDIYFKSIPAMSELSHELILGLRTYIKTASLEKSEEDLLIHLIHSIEQLKDDESLHEENFESFKNVLDLLTQKIISKHEKIENNILSQPGVKKKKYYNQDDFLSKLFGDTHYQSLSIKRDQFSGLCELICNYIIKEDLMGYSAQDTSLERNISGMPKNLNEIQFMAGLYQLNSDWVLNSHILDTSSTTDKLKAYLFNQYPYTLFSSSDVSKDGKQLDYTLLKDQLDALEKGCYVKFIAFAKSLGKMEGHSMLIKKNPDNTYSFFDPNKGEYLLLNPQELCSKLNKALRLNNATHMAFLDGVQYIKKLNKSAARESPAFKSKAQLNVMRIDPLDRQANMHKIYHLLSNAVFHNIKNESPHFIKEIKNILKQIDYNNELNIVQSIIKIKEISNMEPAPDENHHVLALREVFHSSMSTTFASFVANLNKEPQFQRIMDELPSQRDVLSQG